jgi:hypothetical protein
MNESQRRHYERFSKVNLHYPGRVLHAYGGDLRRAMTDTDEQVDVTVAAWERQQGLFVRDWRADGALGDSLSRGA